jgi:tRNA(Ile)-lysidine synthase TilS/MesJ
LPETFPGIKFDDRGVCNHCLKFLATRDRASEERVRYKAKFVELLDRLKRPSERAAHPYDALMAYSGGKDSTYTLRALTEDFGLRVLAVTFDHGFVSPAALKNIRTVTEALDVDRMIIAPGAATVRQLFMKSIRADIYPIKALERASAICNSCMNLIKSFLLRSSIEMRVPLVAYGWSPGQAPVRSSVFKTNAAMIRQMQKAMVTPLKALVGNRLSAFFLSERHMKGEDSSSRALFPVFIHPLAFLDYDEETIVRNVRQLGWEAPRDTDANSTNCLLNGFANQIHIQRYGFHPYALEMAGLVREGYMKREQGLEKLSRPADEKVVAEVRERLGLGNG